MKVPIEILVLLCVLVGVFPQLTVAPLLQAAARAVLGDALPAYSLALWHGISWPLLMSAVALLGGIILYALREPLFTYYQHRQHFDVLQVFENCVQRFVGLVRFFLQKLQRDSLRTYFWWAIGFVVVAVGGALSRLPRLSGNLRNTEIDFTAAIYLLIAGLAALLTVYWHRLRLRGIVAMGVVGLMSALIFARFSAPDLALTQLAVEVVSTLLLLLALNFLPQTAFQEVRSRWARSDLLLATVIGAGVSALAYAVMTRPYDSIAQYFIDHSVPDGGGHNVVNVILVDFRAFDTLGEITVLLIAAVAISALLSSFKLNSGEVESKSDASNFLDQDWQQSNTDNDVLLSVWLRLLLPFVLLLAGYLLLRGHNAPGGGFIAGLVSALVLILPHLAGGRRWMALPARPLYLRMAAAGVALALLTGMASWYFHAPLLTSTFAHWQLPWLGEIEVASAMIFDVGVYVAVLGATLTLLARLGAVAGEGPI